MSWHHNAVFYELYPRAFADGNGDGWGDFTGMLQHLDYLEWLGVDCIWITPFYPSPLGDDGYDISSFYGIHPNYGTIEEFRLVVDEVHRRGMRIIPDLVMNHTSDQHPWFQMARQSKDSPLRDYYVWSDDKTRYDGTRIIFIDTEESNWTWDPISEQYYWHRFFSHQPDLNYDNPKVQQAMLDIVKFWLDLGVDGFRVDAVPYLFEREGTNCENLPETHDFCKKIRKFMDDYYPDAVLLSEANQWPWDTLPYFGDGDEFHMNFHFPLMPRLFMALAKQDRSSIIDILARTPAIPDACQWGTFLRNHDELTLEMVTEEERQFMWETYAPDPRMRLNLGIRRRLAPLMDNNPDKIMLLYSMLFTLPGTPVLYYGDQIGMGDNIHLRDRNGVRTPMQWDASANAGFSTAAADKLYAPVIDDDIYSYKRINVEAQRNDSDSLLNRIRHMVHIFKAQPELADGELIWREDTPLNTLIFSRKTTDGELLCMHNLTGESMRGDAEMLAGMTAEDVLTGQSITIGSTITLPPYGYLWLRLK